MPAITTGGTTGDDTVGASLKRGSIANSLRESVFASGSVILKNFVTTVERPTEIHNLHDVQMNEYSQQMSCFL